MKKGLLSLGLFAFTAIQLNAQTVTVSTGANYANQKWYSLDNGEVGTQPKDNWDIGFEINGYSSTILANTQKTGFAAYKAPYKVADYATIDTTGISSWPMLYNSDTTLAIGAFNRGASTTNAFDLGWGLYDMNTHFVTGDSCYVIKVSATSYKKIKFINLANGTYNFEYANINGTASQTIALAKSAYTGKNFAYFDLAANVAVDREPASANWDLTFVKYTGFIPTAYPLTGVLINKGVTVAQANDVVNVSTYNNFSAHPFVTTMNVIGADWKTYDMTNNVYRVVGDTCYFVKDKNSNIWKTRFIGFAGGTTGDFTMIKEKLTTVGIASVNNSISQVAVYPNPSNGENTTLLFSSEKQLSNVSVVITDLNGRELSSETINVGEGVNTYSLNTKELNSGIYFIRLNAGSYTTTQKLIRY